MDTTNTSYIRFLESKQKNIYTTGINIKFDEINKSCFDFQKHCIQKSLNKGAFALFEDCGLGKTLQQLEWCKWVSNFTNKPVLILTPLSVVGQTIQESLKFGYIKAEKLSIENQDRLNPITYITNYEQLENIDASLFSGIALDESSILKNFEGKTRNLIIEKFASTPFKSCWTATPSPNDPMELGNHSEFLGIMTRNEMLSMYFVHDGGDTSKWRIKGHAEIKFWEWVSTWAIMINKPSDIGFSDDGYNLPPLNMIEKTIQTECRENGMLFNEIAVSATNYNAELRMTKIQRMEEVIQIVNNSDENFIIWIKQNEEGDYLKKMIPGSIEVKGSDSIEYKENKLLGFANNEFRVLITKTKIAQFGLNYQNCGNQIFASLDFSFESLYQAIRRSHRFGRKLPVNIYIITTDTMQNVIQNIKHKQILFTRMQNHMIVAMKKVSESTFSKKEFKECKIQLPTFIKIN